MPVTLREERLLPRSAVDVFRYLRDFSTIEQWDPGVYRATKRDPGPAVVGTRFDLQLRLPGGHQPMVYTLIECHAPSTDAHTPGRLVLAGEGRSFSAHDTLEITPDGPDRCRLHYTALLQFSGVRDSAMRALRPWLTRVGRRAVDGLVRAVTVPALPAPVSRPRLVQRLILPVAWRFTERGYLRMPDKGLSQRLDGQVAVVTGPTSGLGLATACELSRLGASVILLGRDGQRLAAAARHICDFSGADTDRVEIVEADLLSAQATQRAAEQIRDSAERIDILVNNAGALFDSHARTVDGRERALAINAITPARLATVLRDRLAEHRGRVINVASGGMYLQGVSLADMDFTAEAYDGAKAYARAKRVLVDLTRHWAASDPEVSYHAMHPGWAATPGVSKSLPGFDRVMKPVLRDARMGADTIVWLASTPGLEALSGQLWLDRETQPTAVLPRTDSSAAKRARIVAWMDEELARS